MLRDGYNWLDISLTFTSDDELHKWKVACYLWLNMVWSVILIRTKYVVAMLLVLPVSCTSYHHLYICSIDLIWLPKSIKSNYFSATHKQLPRLHFGYPCATGQWKKIFCCMARKYGRWRTSQINYKYKLCYETDTTVLIYPWHLRAMMSCIRRLLSYSKYLWLTREQTNKMKRK